MTPRDGLPPEPGRPDGHEPADASRPGHPPHSEPSRRDQDSQGASGGPGPVGDSGAVAAVGWLPQSADALFGDGAEAEEAYDLLTVDVPAGNWVPALTAARDGLGCTYFDWLSAVDEPGVGFRVCAHLVALPTASTGVRRLLVRTTVPHDAAALPTATGVYAGAAWHERETYEMFGLDFTGHPGLDPLLLPDGFEGHPLRKDFVLAARVVKAWPGAKEPGESGHGGGGRRRQMRPPGVPDPNEWGPQAGQAPPAEERPRRARSASAGSASQRTEGKDAAGPTEAAGSSAPGRSRGTGDRSASQRSGDTGASAAPAEHGAAGPRRARSASGGSASQRAEGAEAEAEGPGPEGAGGSETGPHSADAPWHHARPAFDDEERDGGRDGDSDDGERG